MTNTYASCGHPGCDVRVARGLVPFCQMNGPIVPKVRAANEFDYYSEAAAYQRIYGGRIQSLNLNLGDRKGFAVVMR